jgi:hypothetical protein
VFRTRWPLLLLLLLVPATGRAGAIDLSGWVGAGGALGEHGTVRGLAGIQLEFELLEHLLVGAQVDGGIFAADEDPEAVDVLGELSLAPVLGVRFKSGEVFRLDLLQSIGWTHLLGDGIVAVSATRDLLRLRSEARMTFVTFSAFGHPFHLGLFLAVETYPLGPRGFAPIPLVGGFCFGADVREPANEVR